jgi:hypothetical protein
MWCLTRERALNFTDNARPNGEARKRQSTARRIWLRGELIRGDEIGNRLDLARDDRQVSVCRRENR